MARSELAGAGLRERVQQYLVDAGYQPGDQIEPELTLAEHFEVSRGQIRKVLTAFCQEGLLARRPRAGTVVRSLDPKQVGRDLRFRFRMSGFHEADAVEAREVIENAVLPLAVRRITPRQLSELHELVDQMEQHVDDPPAADQADREFHLLLLESCGNETLSLFASVIEGLFDPRHRQRFWQPKLLAAAAREHRDLLNKIANDDIEGAQAVIRQHFSHYREPHDAK